MESKKLQQLQQANAHLGSQLLPQKKNPSTFHPNAGDYRSSHSPVFQSHLQYHAASSIPQSNLSLQHQSPSSASQSTSISTAPTSHLFSKSPQNLYHPQQINQYGSEQLYQTAQERMYQMASSRSHYPAISHNHPHPVNVVQQQYQQLQQAKIQQQIQTQNEALAHQQRTFALRQQLNPPIPQSHFHIQSQSFMSSQSLQSQAAQQPPINQAPQRTLPPSTLNLSSPCQPAQGPVKLNNIDIRAQHYHQDAQNQHLLQSQAMYQKNQELQQHQQLQSRSYQEKLETGTPSDHGPVYIQQNHPGHVMNQACQTQISGAIGKTKTPNDEQKGTSAHPPLDRKKSSGSIQALKSPLTKRPASSPVTLSGWLYKQGSDGLKVWRKRWFVLSEYCLYYYKGPEEEKVLGSILLPSYKVAACLPEDKIYRKYAFKCEHTNMRTYWLAAENAEQMCQWVRALTAATMMQASSESDQASQPSVSSLNQSGENSDSGIHTFQSQQSKLSMPQGPVTPASDCGGGGGAQPLYANAPPKPKRANDGGYSSPSPENSIDRCETNVESHRHVPSQQRQQANVHSPMSALQQQKSQHHAIYDTRTGSVTSAIRHPTNTDALAAQLHLMNMDRNVISGTYPQHKSSNHIQTGQIVGGAGYQHGVDLEDHIIRAPQRFNDDVGNEIYGERELYMQNHVQQKYPNHIISGVTYPNVDHRKSEVYRTKSGQSRMFSNYEDVYNTGQNRVSQNPEVVGAYRRPTSPPMYTNDKHVPPMPSRYAPSQLENNVQVNLRAKNLQPSGIMRPHSADFLEYEARAEAAGIKPDPIRTPRPKSSLDINRTPDSFYYSEASYAEKMRQSALYLQKPQNQLTNTFSGYKNQDLNPFLGGTNTTSYDRSKRNEISQESLGQDASSIPRSSRHNSKDYRSQQSDQFLRSASARLPRKDEDTLKDGERKREESMKRLLEWKQRMLQSPLTRKGGQQNSPSVPVKVGNISNVLSHGIQRSRSETHANAGYNSYSSDDEASISVRNVRNIPKVNLTVKPEPTDSLAIDSINPTNQYNASVESKHIPTDRNYYSTEGADLHNTYDRDNFYPLRKSGSRAEIDLLERETSSQIRNLDMSAGDLLSRTHEELVLLLIQLRRQNSTTARAIEQCCTEIHDLQNRIRTSDGLSRSESIQRLNFLKQHLIDLEKQYEKSKPLVNLVDNMVKLGSLYRSNESSRHIQSESVTLDRLEFNQKIQERRLLQEEQKHWDRLSPNHTELQSKVRQLYQLDQLLQEESGTLQNLQRDKEDLERALGGLRARLQDSNGQHPLAMEAAKKQQHLLERELSRVHQLLAENSKKLEQTVAGNARLEQELLILRQKLQASRGSRGSQGALGGSQSAGDSIQYASNATALLESELRRVQQLVGDMQRQRQELSQAVRQLTENSNALYQQIGHKDNSFGMSSHIKKRHNSSCWTETDLDSMLSTDHTQSISMENLSASTPLYIDTASANSSGSILNCSSSSRMSGLDDRNMRNGRYSDGERNDGSGLDDELTDNAFANLSNTEKQEIKTVRIVKRESERRHRDRERSANAAMSIQNLDQVLEEDGYNQMSDESHSRSRSLPRTSNDSFEAFKQVPQQKASLINSKAAISSPTSLYRYDDYFANISNPYPVSMSDKNSNLSSYNNYPKKEKVNISNYIGANHEQLFMLKNKTESIQSLTSPVFQSEAARQIISEMSGSASEDNTEKVPLAHKHKRTVPKEKRRHYTAPNNVNTKAIQNMQAENDMNCNNTNWRARDDLDMEVALRPRINAPDVVRSALGHREKISENTIDKLLAAPSKILIPERYIPEKTPELSPEEKKRRQEKVEAIKKMLSEAPLNTANDTVSLPPSKINAEKKQREHLLQLNQILAQQVMQMSKIVAGNPSQSNQK